MSEAKPVMQFCAIGTDANIGVPTALARYLHASRADQTTLGQSANWDEKTYLKQVERKTAVIIDRSGCGFHSNLADEKNWSCFTTPKNRKIETAYMYRGVIDMLGPPAISGSSKMKLSIDPNVEVCLEGERHIRYALNIIFNIIVGLLRDPGFNYKINVVLRDAGNIHGWEHIDIIIKFPDEHYDDITGYWKSISTNVSNFYKSLLQNQEYSEEIVKRICKFIYIIVISEE